MACPASSRRRPSASASSVSLPISSTVIRRVSSARSRSSFAGDTVRPTSTVRRMSCRAAADATAIPWLPLDAVTSAASGRPSASIATLLLAPRSLNAPVGWTSSRSTARRPRRSPRPMRCSAPAACEGRRRAGALARRSRRPGWACGACGRSVVRARSRARSRGERGATGGATRVRRRAAAPARSTRARATGRRAGHAAACRSA